MDACDCGLFCESVYYTAGDEESLADEHVVFPSFAPFFLNPSGMLRSFLTSLLKGIR